MERKHTQDQPRTEQQGSQGAQPQNPNREPAEGARRATGGGTEPDKERGQNLDEDSELEDMDEGSESELGTPRSTGGGERGRGQGGAGITNRGMERERSEQQELPKRGSTKGQSD